MNKRPSFSLIESGEPWIGMVPSYWEKIRIKFCLTSQPKVSDPTLPAGAISFGRVIQKSDEKITAETKATYRIVEKGDFLINPINLNYDLKSLRTALSTINVCVSSAYLVAKPARVKDSPHFLKYLLYVFDILHMKTLGAGVRQTITLTDIGNCFWCLPEIEEQRQIAAYLNRETTKIDKLIAKQQKLINLSKEKLTSLVVTDRMLHDNVRLRHCVDIMNRPVPLEDGNCYSKLGMFNRGRGLFIKPATESTEMGDSDFYWIREGDLIISGQFAWEGAVGIARKEHEHCVVSHRYPVLRGKPNLLLTEYLLVLFWTDFGDFLLNENSRGAAGRNRPLNLRSLLNEKIPLPPLETQRKICELYEWRTRFLKTVEVQKQALLEHRQALITAAVTGKIDVRGLVTDEEVAALDAETAFQDEADFDDSDVPEVSDVAESLDL